MDEDLSDDDEDEILDDYDRLVLKPSSVTKQNNLIGVCVCVFDSR